MNKLSIDIETVTPLYMSGADQSKPEIRAPSIKGLLRYWFRAVDPKYQTNEPLVFGDTDKHGKSPFSIRVKTPETGFRYCHLIKKPEGSHSKPCVQSIESGLRYLAFPFGMNGGIRDAISTEQRFTVIHNIFPNRTKNEQLVKRALLSSWWLLTNIGGMGSRSRRGFGSIRVSKVSCDWNETSELRLDTTSDDVDEWWKMFMRKLTQIRSWLQPAKQEDHTTLCKGTQIILCGESNAKEIGFSSWNNALECIGNEMQVFRKDKDILERGFFGIPITGRRVKVEVKGKKFERRASPILFNVIRIGEQYFVLVTMTNTTFLPEGTQLFADYFGKKQTGLPNSILLEEFFKDLRKRRQIKGVKL